MRVKNMNQFHREVCKRDNYICQGCKTNFNYPKYFDENTGMNNYVCGHHKLTQGSRIDLQLETDNGVCLCKECHGMVHSGELRLGKESNVGTTTFF